MKNPPKEILLKWLSVFSGIIIYQSHSFLSCKYIQFYLNIKLLL